MAVTTIKGPIGIQFGNVDAVMINSTGEALAAGDLASVDVAQATATTTGFGLSTSVFAHVTDTVATGDGAVSIYCVATEAIAAGAKGTMRFSGLVDVNTIAVDGGQGVLDEGMALYKDPDVENGFTNSYQDLDAGNDLKCIAICLAVTAKTVLFDGIHGFGSEAQTIA